MLRLVLEALITATWLKVREVDYRRPLNRSQTVYERRKLN
jgi:hypothetical protein